MSWLLRSVVVAAALAALIAVGRFERSHEATREVHGFRIVERLIGPLDSPALSGYRVLPGFDCLTYRRGGNVFALELCVDRTGRVVEAISHSKQWKDYCIFIIEDDAQSGYDHVDGHRTIYSAISPYTRRKFVDHTLYTTLSMLKSIELMLGLDPMNRFDALTPPLTTCFSDTPDLTPFDAVPNTTMIGDMNPPVSAQNAAEKRWTKISLALDWSGPDRADPVTLNHVLWHTLHGVDAPYPGEEGR